MKKKINVLLILLFLIQYYSLSISAAASNETGQQALLDFQNLITSPNHVLANNWTKNTSFCSWFGVTCSPRRQRVAITNNPRKQSKLKKVVLKVVTPVVISLFLIFLSVSVWIMKRKKKGKSKDVEKVAEIKTHQLVSYHEIQRATNNFDGSNLLGVGSSGSVYKGTLSCGSSVAIKVLHLENEQVRKRFDAECEVMRNVRHRKLIPVITTCSSDYISAFALQYMPNGSLENWLYREESHLNLLQRFVIMLDVAVAIEYLHHGHNTPISHCDLKPANVLLDEDMVTHVGDFGISKILAVSKSLAHTETLGTLGYIAPDM